MKIYINNQAIEIAQPLTLAQAIADYGDKGPFAVALNGQFVAKPNYDDTVVGDGDRLEVLSPIEGG